jgi:hypothetical protein
VSGASTTPSVPGESSGTLDRLAAEHVARVRPEYSRDDINAQPMHPGWCQPALARSRRQLAAAHEYSERDLRRRFSSAVAIPYVDAACERDTSEQRPDFTERSQVLIDLCETISAAAARPRHHSSSFFAAGNPR